jgi:hypothetical protein
MMTSIASDIEAGWYHAPGSDAQRWHVAVAALT